MSEPLFGLINVHKPAGTTSRRVVDRVAKAVKPAKAGHAGTLDPMATGVLIVCVGRATRLIGYVQQLRKFYSAGFILGRRSDTDDVTGDVVDVPVETPPTRDAVEAALADFVGTIEQVPPRYSAVHVDGRRAYQLARTGREVELAARPVEVARLELKRYAFPELDVEIECGSGTYVRSIGRDLGDALGCGAVMSRLVRTAIGGFHLDDAVALDAISRDSAAELLLPAATAVANMPQHRCSEADLLELQHGRSIDGDASLQDEVEIAVVGPDGRLAAIAEPVVGNRLAPRQVFCQ